MTIVQNIVDALTGKRAMNKRQKAKVRAACLLVDVLRDIKDLRGLGIWPESQADLLVQSESYLAEVLETLVDGDPVQQITR